MNLKRPPANADIQSIREWRREYMRAYRSGNTGHHQPAKKISSKVPGKQFRQVSYYLDEDVLIAMQKFCETHQLNRNTVVTMSLEKFFGHRRYKHEIRISDTPFAQKRFLHDRIDSNIYDHVDEFTKTLGKYERQIRITSVIEQAIRELVLCNVQYAHGIKLESRSDRKLKSANSRRVHR